MSTWLRALIFKGKDLRMQDNFSSAVAKIRWRNTES